MARLEDTLRTALLANGAVAALVPNRIYPGELPQNVVYPAVRYNRVSTNRTDTRPMTGGSRHARVRVQYDCYVRSVTGAWDLAEAVFRALDGWSGTNGDIRVGAASPEEQIDGSEADPVGMIYWRTVDVLVGYTHG